MRKGSGVAVLLIGALLGGQTAGPRTAGPDHTQVRVAADQVGGNVTSVDRRRCSGPLNGPRATGDHCPEGWRFHRLPGPTFLDVPRMSVESSYYTWVDQHDTLGLGAKPLVVHFQVRPSPLAD